MLNRLPLRFSLRTLLVVMLVCGVLLGAFARAHSRAQRQRQIIAAAAEVGGHVRYDFECYSQSWLYAPQRWLAPRVGPDLVGNVLILNYQTAEPASWRESLQSAADLQTIEYLSACGHGLTAADVEQLGRCTALKQLNLLHARDLPDLKPLGKLRQLAQLGLNSCSGVKGAKLSALRELQRLKTIDLCGSDATDEVARELAKLPMLDEINVEFSQITHTGLLELGKSQSLRVVHIDDTQAEQGIAKALPSIKFDVK